MPLVTSQQFQAPSILSSIQQGLVNRGEIQRQGMLTREEANKQRLQGLAEQQQSEQRGLLQTAMGVEGVSPAEATPQEAVNLFYANNPEEGEKLFKRLGIQSNEQKQDLAAFADTALEAYKSDKPEDVQFLIDERVRQISARDGDPSETLMLKDLLKNDPDKFIPAMQGAKAAALTALQREEIGLRKEGLELEREGMGIKTINLAQNIKKMEIDLKKTEAEGAEKKFDQEGKLRKGYTDASQEFIKSRDANDRILASLEDPSAAGDLSLVFNFMKLLDPGSTVREGEFANAQNSGGVSDITRAKYNSLISGERLSTNIRKDFEERAKKLYNKAKQTQDKTVSEYSRLSKKYKLDPANVIIDLESEAAPLPQGVTEDDVAETMRIHGVTRQQVLDRLRGQ